MTEPNETIIELTPEQLKEQQLEAVRNGAKEKAALLSEKLKRKVFPIVLLSANVKDEYVIGFAYKPDLTTQCRLIDKSDGSKNGIDLETAVTVITLLYIPGECDQRLIDTSGEHYDLYTKGAAYSLVRFMGLAMPVFF